MLTEPAVASSVLAFVTTIHLALASLRNHRRATPSPANPVTFVSLAFAVTPWLLPSALGVMFGLGAHAVWFAVCERLAPAAAVAGAAAGAGSAAGSVAFASRGASTARVTAAMPAARSAASTPPRTDTGFVQAPIIAALDETGDIKTIRIARPEGYEFEAGQFVTVRMRVDGKDCVRCYSISSAPDVRGYLEISVKRQGVVSSALHTTARAGNMLSIRRPNGKFKYPSNDDRPIVLLAGGVGVTPLMSMLRHAIHTEPARPITLVYAAQTSRDFAFRDELLTIAQRHPQARVVFTASREKAPRAPIQAGRIDERLLRNAAPGVAHSIAFVCGPEPMVSSMKTLLANLGVPPAQIRSELFQAAMAAAVVEVPLPARMPKAGRAGHDMHCAVSGMTVPVGAGETLLEAAESHGVNVPSLCRAGVCGTSPTRVTAGQVDCASTTLDADDRADGFVLACVATVRSACTVEL